MHPDVLAGLALALACAVGTNLGGLWKQKGAVATKDVDVRRPIDSAVALFRSKWWVIGWLVAAFGWALHVGALALAPLSLAQAVIAGGLVSLGVLAERYFGFELGRRQWAGLALVALGMAFLASTSGSQGDRKHYELVAMIAFEAGAVGLSAVCVMAGRSRAICQHQGILLGATAGLLFGLSDVSIKAVTTGSGGLLGATIPWSLTALLAGIVAFYASARSLQIGDGVAVITATAAAANLLGILGGVVVFGDPLGSGSVEIAGKVAAFVLVVAAIGLIPAPVRAERAIAEEEQDEASGDATSDESWERADYVPAA